MAVFFKNDCKFYGCGKIFPTLSSLIKHIESTHIDFNSNVSEELENQCVSAVPLSYVLKYSQNLQQIESNSLEAVKANKQSDSRPPTKYSSIINEKDIFSESEGSNDSWTPSRESLYKKNNSYFYLSYGEKPFVCSIPGCTKRYKNISGIKYHYKNGHKNSNKSKKTSKQLKVAKTQIHKMKKKISDMSSYFPLTWSKTLGNEDIHSTDVKLKVVTLHNVTQNNELDYTYPLGDSYNNWSSLNSAKPRTSHDMLMFSQLNFENDPY